MTNPKGRRRWLILGSTWLLAAIAVLPVVLHWTAPAPRTWTNVPAVLVGYLLALALCLIVYRVEGKRLTRSQVITLVVLIFLQTHFANYVHHFLVDKGNGWSEPTNTVWQKNMQAEVVRLSPAVLPHSYRFLPNSIVLWMQMVGIQFEVARDIYQLLAGILLFYALYRFARLYTTYTGALFTMILAGLVYPISFVGYAGQLTDPLSHLSFLLAFIFLETEEFPFLLTTLLIGSLAKETVLGLLGYYVLFCRGEKHYEVKAALLTAVSVSFYYGVRLYVLHGAMGYKQVSNVSLSHAAINFGLSNWRPHLLIAVGAYVPFLILGWKMTAPPLKRLALYLFPVLFISSLLFSWLNEARNFMPLVFVLAVVAGHYFNSLQTAVDNPANPSLA